MFYSSDNSIFAVYICHVLHHNIIAKITVGKTVIMDDHHCTHCVKIMMDHEHVRVFAFERRSLIFGVGRQERICRLLLR